MIKHIHNQTYVEYLANGEARIVTLHPDRQYAQVEVQCSSHFIEEILQTMDSPEVELDLSDIPFIYRDGWDRYLAKMQ